MSLRRPVSTADSSPAFGADSMLASGPPTVNNPRHCPKCRARYPADFKVCPRDATPLEDAPPDADDPMIGQQLSGTYEVLRVIGEGGMGRVYEARHVRLAGKHFAIKMLHHELARQPDVVTRFQREAEAASSLSHPYVVGVFDVNTAPDGRPYIVAELLEGEELGEYLDRVKKLPVAEAVRLIRQVCVALDLAHERGIVHRDVKPENVFVMAGSQSVKVLDFGISKIAESNSSLTKTGMVMGTPDYMAPEQARGDRVDARADVYAVGAILYRALTGQKPFEGLDGMATLTAALVTEPPRPSSLESTITLPLELVIQRAMAKNPAERYQSMRELDQALAPFDDGAPPLSAPGSEQQRVDPSARTLLTQVEAAPSSTLHRQPAKRVRRARPGLLFFSVLGFAWLFVNAAMAIGAVIRFVHRDDDLSGDTPNLVLAIALVAVLAPVVLWLRHLVQKVWPSTPRAMETALRLRRIVLYSMCAYGVSVLGIGFFETILQRSAHSATEPRWALVSALFAAIAGGATYWANRPAM